MHVAIGVYRLRFNIPLGAAYVAATLRRAGHRVSVFTFGSDPDRAIRALRSEPPDLVAYGVLSGEQRTYLEFHRRLVRSVPVPSVWGGPHPTYDPAFVHEEGVDAVCVGEAEDAMAEFVDRTARDGRLPRDVGNFRVKAGGNVVANPVRPPVEDLDRLPFPARDLFVRAHPFLRRHRIRHVIARRGCAGACTYCFNASWRSLYGEKRPRIRARSPENVCAEIDEIRRSADLELVGFVDDSFAQDSEWIESFAKTYTRRVGLPYSCNLRPEHCTDEIVARLAESGCRLTYLGVESGDGEVRRLLGRAMADRVIRDALRRLRGRGIRVITENMIGIPGETFAQAMKTLRLNQEERPAFANCSFFTPYPGLPLTRYAIRHGHFDGSEDGIEENYYHRSPLRSLAARERNRIVNLRAFFGLLARRPGLLPLVRPVLSAPPNALIRIAGDLLDGYALWRCAPYRMSPALLLRMVAGFLRYYR